MPRFRPLRQGRDRHNDRRVGDAIARRLCNKYGHREAPRHAHNRVRERDHRMNARPFDNHQDWCRLPAKHALQQNHLHSGDAGVRRAGNQHGHCV